MTGGAGGPGGPADGPTLLSRRLQKNLRRLEPWARKHDIRCYRIYDRDMPQVPLAIDLYGDHLIVHVYEPRHGIGEREVAALAAAAQSVLGLPSQRVHIKRRVRTTGGTGYASEGEPVLTEVQEGGLTFLIQPEAHIDVGLFLDHRPLRAQVRREARGKRVLNLFAYTGSFSVFAAAGGAATTTTVDLSPVTARWAEQNLAINGFGGAAHRVVVADTREFLRGDSGGYDIAIVDPPTVSRSKRAAESFEVQRDHQALLQSTLDRLVPGGVAYFSTNFTAFAFSNVSGARAEEISAQTVPEDFTHRPPPHRSWRLTRTKN